MGPCESSKQHGSWCGAFRPAALGFFQCPWSAPLRAGSMPQFLWLIPYRSPIDANIRKMPRLAKSGRLMMPISREGLVRGNAMSASHQAYRHARLERLLDDPNLLRRCPAPTALKRCAASPSLKTACWRARGLGHDAVRGSKNCNGSGQSLTNRKRAQLKWNQPAGFSLA